MVFIKLILITCILVLNTPILVQAETNLPECTEIVINEVLPDPEGSDTGLEWIELYNPSNTECTINNWLLKDKSTTTHILTNLNFGPDQFQIIYPKFTLNQTNEEITLISQTDVVIDSISYSTSHESLSLARIPDGVGDLTPDQTPTPGASNNPTITDTCFQGIEQYSIKDFKSLDEKSHGIIQGFINSAPGFIYKDKFYFQGNTGGVLVDKGSIDHDFQEGDYLKLSVVNTIKNNIINAELTSQDCIQEIPEDEITSLNIETGPLTIKDGIEDLEGMLVELSGVIQKKNGDNLYIENDLDTFVTNISKITDQKEVSKEDTVKIIGIVNIYTTGGETKQRIIAKNIEVIPIINNNKADPQASVKAVSIDSPPKQVSKPLLFTPMFQQVKNKFSDQAIGSKHQINTNLQIVTSISIIGNIMTLLYMLKFYS